MHSSLLSQLAGIRVLVIGDLMLDHYLWGDSYRISPEAPVPVVHAFRDTYAAGGAANVTLNLANLGATTSALGYCGNDEAGVRLKDILTSHGVTLQHSGEPTDAPTIIKTRVIVRNQQLCRIDREAVAERYRIDAFEDFDPMIDALLAATDAVILSDYAKGCINQAVVDKVMEKSRQYGVLVAVDPKPANAVTYKGVGLLTPNRNEALQLAGIPQLHPDEKYPIEEVCRNIHEAYYPDLLIITLGAEGMAICSKGEVIKHLSTVAKEVFDVSGAGDTVIATLTAALAAGMNAEQAAWLANGAAGCVVAHMGTVPVKYGELDAWLAKQ